MCSFFIVCSFSTFSAGGRGTQEYRNIFRYFLLYSVMEKYGWPVGSYFDSDVVLLRHMSHDLLRDGKLGGE